MSRRDQIETRMRDLTTFIIQATDTVRAGKMVKLSHLDDEVASLCDQSLSLPPAEALQIQPIMADMIARLEDLAQALKDFQNLKRGGAQ